MRRSLAIFALYLLTVQQATAIADEAPLSRIAFGSCARQDRPQPIWDAVVKAGPQLFVFLGDNIYADTEDMDVLRAKYQLLSEQPGYRKLKQTCPILATWDDHDYGANDAGAEYPKKRESQQIFLDFFAAPANDVRRIREGVYSARVVGPPGKRVQIILLDSRYFRSPLKTGFQPGEPGDGFRGKYLPNADAGATLLGEVQWRWLEEQLKVPAELRIIGSSVQVVADEHGSEMWGNFPQERRRLFRLIRETNANGVVFLSGDRHLAEIARLPGEHPLGIGYPLFDITSSSLNVPSGNLTKSGTRFANEINSYRVGLTYFETNFGVVQIDWEQADPLVRLQVRDEKGGVVLQQRVALSQLAARRTAKAAKTNWKETSALAAPEAVQAAAADEKFIYAIANTQIAQYDRQTGRRVAVSTGEAKHLNSGFLWDGRLYCAHSNFPQTPEQSEIKVLDLKTMRLSTFKDFGNYGGSLTWAVRRDAHW